MESPSVEGRHHHSSSFNGSNTMVDYNIDTTFLISFAAILLSFILWRSPLLSQLITSFSNFFNSNSTSNSSHSSTSTVPLSPESRSSTTSSTTTTNNINSSTSNETTQHHHQHNQPDEATPPVTIPFEETFSSNVQDLTKINFILSEQVYHRTFRSTSIIRVLDLKKYFFPNEYQDGKRIIFIYNGRALVDTEQLNPLTADQITNDPNYSTESTSAFTWMCTKTLYILTGLFLVILWSLKVTSPKLFNFFSTIMLLVFTLFWAFGFYSSLKTNHHNFATATAQHLHQQ
ncbi:hypothetical protein CYY_008581 [Polysphondylium violaceum]|uniref:Ubiquitin-like domain-containing protein n=1 Tax=Polysphondylium violaceum TaxID=133409 RepID=A0A8J4V148_9MYCE|nr:hypothetical protein CYY_008581 [Polysphondylium violaceum]